MKLTPLIPFSLATLIVMSAAAVTLAQAKNEGASAEVSAGDALFGAIRAGDADAVRQQLGASPELIKVRRQGASVVMAALFLRRNQFEFTPPAANPVLAAVLSANPELDIFEAAGTGRVERMRHILAQAPALARAWEPSGWAPLHLAAFGGSAAAVALLLEHGADIHARAKTRFRTTPLNAAVLNGQYPTTRLLLERGADVLVRQANGATCLHEAAFACRRDLVELLLAHGATVSPRSDDGRTPLDEARRSKCEAVAALLEARAAPAHATSGR